MIYFQIYLSVDQHFLRPDLRLLIVDTGCAAIGQIGAIGRTGTCGVDRNTAKTDTL